MSPKEKREGNEAFDNQYKTEKLGLFHDGEEEDGDQDYMDEPSQILNDYMPSDD